MQFHGEYQHTVDTKGRVSLPAKFRKALPDEVVVVPGVFGGLSVFSEEGYAKWVEAFFPPKEDGTSGYNQRSRKDVMFRKMLNASAENTSVDSAGRITLSVRKREDANITKDVLIIGDDDHIEIWDVKSYEEAMEGISFDDFMV